MTASNHTYSFLVGTSRHPSNGTGMPQSMSRVIARGRMSARMFFENRITFGRQVRDSSRPSSHSASASATAGRSRKKWRVSTNSGVSPLIRETGFFKSAESS